MNNFFFYFFYSLANQNQFLDSVIVFFAVTFPFIVVILAGLFLLFHHEILRAENPFRVFLEKKKEILIVFFSAFLAYFASVILKTLFHTARPFILLPGVSSLFGQSGYAFPSGHATFFGALAFSIFFMHKKAGYVFMLFALLIGIARIASGVHFPIDILGGLILGAITAYFVKILQK